jgi:hypothetical protein
MTQAFEEFQMHHTGRHPGGKVDRVLSRPSRVFEVHQAKKLKEYEKVTLKLVKDEAESSLRALVETARTCKNSLSLHIPHAFSARAFSIHTA